jgi:hypothetical protein
VYGNSVRMIVTTTFDRGLSSTRRVNRDEVMGSDEVISPERLRATSDMFLRSDVGEMLTCYVTHNRP